MRYVIQFADRTSKTVSEEEGKAALAAWAQGRPLVLRGAGYAHHLISAIKPMSQWAEDQVAQAKKDGYKLCRYGTVHNRLSDCLCWEAGKEPVEELAAILPSPRIELPEAPPTREVGERTATWREVRKEYVMRHSVPVQPDDCRCNGTGQYEFRGTVIPCECSLADRR